MLFLKEEWRRRKMEGIPGYPNQTLGLHKASQDQVDCESFNLRRVDEDDPLRPADRQAAEAARLRAHANAATVAAFVQESKPADRLDRSCGPPTRCCSHVDSASRVGLPNQTCSGA